jgi:ribonuclease-3
MRKRRSHQESVANGNLIACQEAIGYLFRREGLLRKALTHSSVKDQQHPSNERLEFLGDAILGMVISEYLFSTLPEKDEGELTKVKSVVVSGESLSRLGLEMGIDRFLLIGKGLRLKKEIPRSLIANAIEAIIAAVYLDRGMEAARHFVLDHLHGYVEEVLNDDHREKNYKSLLQQYAQKLRGLTPTYRVLGERGPDHSKVFRVSAVIGRKEYPVGTGACKKDAEQDAARIALQGLRKSRERPARKKAKAKAKGAAEAPAVKKAKPAKKKARGAKSAPEKEKRSPAPKKKRQKPTKAKSAPKASKGAASAEKGSEAEKEAGSAKKRRGRRKSAASGGKKPASREGGNAEKSEPAAKSEGKSPRRGRRRKGKAKAKSGSGRG